MATEGTGPQGDSGAPPLFRGPIVLLGCLVVAAGIVAAYFLWDLRDARHALLGLGGLFAYILIGASMVLIPFGSWMISIHPQETKSQWGIRALAVYAKLLYLFAALAAILAVYALSKAAGLFDLAFSSESVEHDYAVMGLIAIAAIVAWFGLIATNTIYFALKIERSLRPSPGWSREASWVVAASLAIALTGGFVLRGSSPESTLPYYGDRSPVTTSPATTLPVTTLPSTPTTVPTEAPSPSPSSIEGERLRELPVKQYGSKHKYELRDLHLEAVPADPASPNAGPRYRFSFRIAWKGRGEFSFPTCQYNLLTEDHGIASTGIRRFPRRAKLEIFPQEVEGDPVRATIRCKRDLTMLEMGAVGGRTIDAITGKAVRGALITCRRTVSGESGNDGRFFLSGVIVGKHRCVATERNHRPVEHSVRVRAESTSILVFRMQPK